MGCGASLDARFRQTAEAEFFAEQRRARQAALEQARGKQEQFKQEADKAAKPTGGQESAPGKKDLPPNPARLALQQSGALVEPSSSVPTPRKKSASVHGGALSGGALSVGAVFRAALEDQCEVKLTAETLPTIVHLILKALDKDSNGSIELSDLRKFIQTVCHEANMDVPPDEQIAEVFTQLDIDRNGSISSSELAAVMFRWFIVGVC